MFQMMLVTTRATRRRKISARCLTHCVEERLESHVVVHKHMDLIVRAISTTQNYGGTQQQFTPNLRK